MNRKTSGGGFWVALAIFVVLAAIAAAWYLVRKISTDPDTAARPGQASPAAATTAATPGSAESIIQHPIGPATSASAAVAPASVVPLSDADVVRELGVLGGDGLVALLRPEQLIPRMVATIDALPRQGMNPRILPLRPPSGSFAVSGAADGSVVADAAANGIRYAPYLALLERVDGDALVDWYVQHYASFQQAYRELGYPRGYFNDRLIQAIDDLLAAPASTAAGLEDSRGYYRYTDPALESLSNGQKWMLRLSPSQSTLVRERLRQIRARLAGQRGGVPTTG